MRWIAGVCALLIGASVSGCALLEAEKYNRGGFLDEIADDVWMKADSKKMRALRAVALEASLARIAMITPKTAPDRALLARRIGETTRRADVVRLCAFSQAPLLAGQRPGEPCFFFDSVMVDYENALFDLALISLPIDDAKALITRVAGGVAQISVNPLQLVQALLDIGREAFRYGRVVGAIYRDTLELEVQVWLTSPEFANSERARGQLEEFVVTSDKVAALRVAYARGNDNIPQWRGEIAALRAQGLEPVPDERFVAEIYAILVYICGQIVSTQDDSYAECAFKSKSLTMPVATGPGGALFRAGIGISPGTGRVGGTGAGRAPVSGAGRAPGGVAGRTPASDAGRAAGSRPDRPELPTTRDYALIVANYNPAVHNTISMQFTLRRLCVPDNELNKIDAKTKLLVKVFQQTIGVNMTGLLTQPEIAQLNNLAACPLERALNYYEAREAVVNSPDTIAQLNKALPNGRKLAATASVRDVRTRIPEVRQAVRANPTASPNLQLLEPELANQLTLDLMNALILLP